MGLGTWEKVGYALSGALTGVAANIEKEEERREKKSNTILAGIIKNSDSALEDSTLSLKEQKEFDAKVESLKGRTYIDPSTGDKKNITEAQAIYAVTTYGDKLAEKLANNEIAFASKGEVIRVPASLRGKIPNPLDMPEDKDNVLFYKDRNRKAVASARAEAEAMGYKTGGYPVYTLPTATGVQEIPGVGLPDPKSRTTYLFNKDNVPLKPVRTVETMGRNGIPTTKHYDFISGQEITIAEGQKIGETKDDFVSKAEWKTFGVVVKMVDGIPTPTGEYGFQMKDGTFRSQTANGPSESVMTDAVDIIPTDKLLEFQQGQDYYAIREDIMNSKFGGKLFTQQGKVLEQAQAVEAIEYTTNIRNNLYTEFGQDMFGVVGFTLEALNRVSTEAAATYDIVTRFADADWDGSYSDQRSREEARFSFVANNEEALRNLSANRASILENIQDRAERVAIARTIDKSLTILTAYDLAKATGDTRISDQDFKAFLQTVKSGTAKTSVNLLKTRMEVAIQQYESAVKSFNSVINTSYLSGNPPDSPKTDFLRGMLIGEGHERAPSAFKARTEAMFADSPYILNVLNENDEETITFESFGPAQDQKRYAKKGGEYLVDKVTGDKIVLNANDDEDFANYLFNSGMAVKQSQYQAP